LRSRSICSITATSLVSTRSSALASNRRPALANQSRPQPLAASSSRWIMNSDLFSVVEQNDRGRGWRAGPESNLGLWPNSTPLGLPSTPH
jgi:hypothetical protein